MTVYLAIKNWRKLHWAGCVVWVKCSGNSSLRYFWGLQLLGPLLITSITFPPSPTKIKSRVTGEATSRPIFKPLLHETLRCGRHPPCARSWVGRLPALLGSPVALRSLHGPLSHSQDLVICSPPTGYSKGHCACLSPSHFCLPWGQPCGHSDPAFLPLLTTVNGSPLFYKDPEAPGPDSPPWGPGWVFSGLAFHPWLRTQNSEEFYGELSSNASFPKGGNSVPEAYDHCRSFAGGREQPPGLVWAPQGPSSGTFGANWASFLSSPLWVCWPSTSGLHHRWCLGFQLPGLFPSWAVILIHQPLP